VPALSRQHVRLAAWILWVCLHAHVRSEASPYFPANYNVTYVAGINSANFDQSGNLVGQLYNYQTYTYITSGPDAGQYHVVDSPSGYQQSSIIYRIDSAPTSNPGPLPGEQSGYPIAANNSGQIIGMSFASHGIVETAQHGYLYSGGQMIPLVPAGNGNGTWDSIPEVINQAGQVAGEFISPGGEFHAFRFSNGKMTDLGTFGGPVSYG